MDAAKRLAIEACGRCGLPERDHQYRRDEDEESISVLFALGGPCPAYVASDAAVIYAKHLAITDNRAPVRSPGRVRKRAQLCTRCGHRGHPKETCPF